MQRCVYQLFGVCALVSRTQPASAENKKDVNKRDTQRLSAERLGVNVQNIFSFPPSHRWTQPDNVDVNADHS